MRIAYLILAYHQPGHVADMIGLLDDADARFFVHVDDKVDIRPFRESIDSPRATFLEDRRTVNWGGWHMIQATLDLLQLARASGSAFDYYQLLSDSCYPIKSRDETVRRIGGDGANFIAIKQVVDRTSPFHWWINQYHWPDALLLRRYERHAWYNLGRRLLSRLFPRRVPGGLTPYYGSQWWCLSAACVDHILEFVDRHPDFVRFYRHTRIPDEMFFHTIVGNSAFAGSVWPPMLDQSCAPRHLIYWKDSRPVVLQEAHCTVLLDSPACFARKFDAQRSAGLIGMLRSQFRE